MKCKSQFHRELRCARERAELHVLHVTTQFHSVSVQPVSRHTPLDWLSNAKDRVGKSSQTLL